MSHALDELAQLARETVAERLRLDAEGQWQFVTPTAARPLRIAKLRLTGITTAHIIEEFSELTPIDVKAARIVSYLTVPDLLSRLDLLQLPEHHDLVMRLQELAALRHEGRGCCEFPRTLC